MEAWQYRMLKQPKKSKYKAKKTVVDGMTFDSKKESKEWATLCMLQKAGQIDELYRQVAFPLIPTIKYGDETVRGCKYFADFYYHDKDLGWVAQDTKGYQTPDYKIKKKLFLQKYVYTGQLIFIESGKDKKIYKKL